MMKGNHLSSAPAGDTLSNTETLPPWKKKSNQALRYEMEQAERAQAKALLMTSQVRSHQVDRMYFMSGKSLNLGSKYRIEPDELRRLKELARVRKEARIYGDGFSQPGFVNKYASHLHDESEVPIQPPPSSLGDHEGLTEPEDADEETAKDTLPKPDDAESNHTPLDVTGNTMPDQKQNDLEGTNNENDEHGSFENENSGAIVAQNREPITSTINKAQEQELLSNQHGSTNGDGIELLKADSQTDRDLHLVQEGASDPNLHMEKLQISQASSVI